MGRLRTPLFSERRRSFGGFRLAWSLGVYRSDLFRFFRLFRYGHRSGKNLRISFLENFDYPYISKSVTEFWRRWHISLSTWFRDYIYIPLGGVTAQKASGFLICLSSGPVPACGMAPHGISSSGDVVLYPPRRREISVGKRDSERCQPCFSISTLCWRL